MSSPMRKEELDLGLHLSCGEIHAKEAPTCDMEWNNATQEASPWFNPSSIKIGSEEGSMDLSAAQPVGMASGSKTGAGSYVPPPVANKLDPPQLTIAPDAPAINLNLLPQERQEIPVSGNPFERPFPRVGGKDLGFWPLILESSEPASVFEQRRREAQVAEANSKRERRYKWPAKTVATIDKKIEKLKKEAARDQAERRTLRIIEAEIDGLQARVEQIHARVSGQQGESNHAGSGHGLPPPPPFGN